MKNISLIASLSLALMPLGCNVSKAPPASPDITHPTSQPQPGIPEGDTTDRTFDFYLLNLSWSPEFCHSHPNARECAQRSTLVLHGLWPQNNTGPYIQNCSTDPGPRNPAAYSDIYPDPGLLRHEWRTHGTCSGLSADDFFNLARKAFRSVAIPPTLAQLDHQISLPPTQLITLFQQANPNIPAASLAISCGNNYLTAVEVCLNKSAQPSPCGNIRSCRANTVRITPP